MTAKLHELELEVEAARGKLARDLATLTSPRTFSDFKDGIKQEVLHAKDAMVESTKSAVTSGVQQFVDDITAKAAANPAAALAIGAGVAWRIFQRPPVATTLIGVGLYSLLRTQAPYSGLYDEDGRAIRGFSADGKPEAVTTASHALDGIKHQAQEFGRYAGDIVRQAGVEIREKSSALTDQATALVHDAQDATGDIMATTTEATSRASHAVSDTLRDSDSRDAVLLGAAALAIAAAIGISYTRRTE